MTGLFGRMNALIVGVMIFVSGLCTGSSLAKEHQAQPISVTCYPSLELAKSKSRLHLYHTKRLHGWPVCYHVGRLSNQDVIQLNRQTSMLSPTPSPKVQPNTVREYTPKLQKDDTIHYDIHRENIWSTSHGLAKDNMTLPPWSPLEAR